jgi:cation transport ATPase
VLWVTVADFGPAPRRVPCGTCGKSVDALRAPRVRIFGTTFRFFCSAPHAELFDPSKVTQLAAPPFDRVVEAEELEAESVTAPSREPTPAPPSVATPDVGTSLPFPPPEALLSTRSAEPVPASTRSALEATLADAVPPGLESRPLAAEAPLHQPTVAAPARVRSLTLKLPGEPALLVTAAVCGTFSVALLLIGPIDWALTLRTLVLIIGAFALVLASFSSARELRQLDRASELGGPLLATVLAVSAWLTDHTAVGTALTTAALLVGSLALGKLLVRRVTAPLDAKRRAVSLALGASARRVRGDAAQECAADELRSGEEIVVHSGELIPADGTVVAGQGEIVPWFEGPRRERVGPGVAVVAGARVVSGSLRIIAGWTGADRAYLRTTSDRQRRADLHSVSARAGYLVAQRAAPLAALLTAFAGVAVHDDLLVALLTAAATQGALSCPGIAELGAARMARACFDALARGIAFRGAEELDAAGRITVAALCARGTVLLGEPEVASIEPLQGQDVEQVLALAAGGESVVSHPVATAVLRAARARGVRPDGARSHNPTAGLGVTAVASSGKPLIVGSRALMLREKVSVALAERRITELEALGRTALLVALDGRLVGILALQDGLRPGARAAVQHLLDVDVEPVLLSGDSRETTEAVGRSIDIEHVRPELLASQRGEEVSKLSDGGAVVAVVGKSPIDDVALAAADVSVALGAPAATNAEWSVGLVTDDVRDAARAIRIAHRAKDDAKKLLAACLVPAGTVALAAAFGLLPAAMAPVAALAGTLGACLKSREE